MTNACMVIYMYSIATAQIEKDNIFKLSCNKVS